MSQTSHTSVPRGFKWLLGLSLALNLAILGFGAGVLMHKDGPGHRFARAPGAESYAAPYVMALPREERRALFRALRAERENRLPERGARRAHYENVIAALRAEPFDTDALSTALKAQHGMALTMQAAVQEVWFEHVSQMTPEARETYAAAIEEILKRGPRKAGKTGGG